MRRELLARVERARELGLAAEITDHIAASLAVFLELPDSDRSYAVGSFAAPGRLVAPLGLRADAILGVAGDDVHVIDVDDRTVRRPRTQVGTRDACEVTLDGARTPELVGVGHAIARTTVVAAAELAGVARGALDVAIGYATTREQFGAPIATYQALAHRLVDMRIAVDAAELAVEQAAIEPMALHAARAKICANRAGQLATAGLHQVHGGVGYYADQPPPAYFARALALSVEMGDTRHHHEVVARHHNLLA